MDRPLTTKLCIQQHLELLHLPVQLVLLRLQRFLLCAQDLERGLQLLEYLGGGEVEERRVKLVPAGEGASAGGVEVRETATKIIHQVHL